MSRGLRVALFMTAASLGNILVTAVLFIASLGLYSLTLARILPEGALVWAILAGFALSLLGSVLVYRKALALIRRKVDLDAWLGFSGKR